MLKLACIFLLVDAYQCSASNTFEYHMDTINIVPIKVIGREKTQNHNNSSSFKDKNVADTDSNILRNVPSNKPSATKNRSPIRQDKNQYLKSVFKAPILIELTKKSSSQNNRAISQKEGDQQQKQSRNSDKDINLLISLLLIITGTIGVLFYRSGVLLILAILFIIAGYYLFIYSWLFMI